MNFKTFISLLVAITLGLAAVWVGRQMIMGQGTSLTATTETTKVVVAKHDLEAGTPIDAASDLKIIDMRSVDVPAKAFTDPQQMADRILGKDVAAGQVMFEGLLARVGADGGLVALVPKGMRAVSVEVNESSGVSGLLAPGCRVDVIATLRQDNGAGQMARTIVENAKVQGVGQRITNKGDERGPAAKTVTLIVTSKDAEAIELASTFGRPRLVLRGTADTEKMASSGITSAELTGPSAIVSTPAQGPTESPFEKFMAAMIARGSQMSQPAVPQRWPVQFIRGNAETTVFYDVKKGGTAGASETEGSMAANPASDRQPEKTVEKDVR